GAAVSASEFASTFFLAVVAILLFCRLVSWLLGKVGQPAVVGEMIAGVLLGPSLLGLLLPGVEGLLFPDALRPVLNVAGQIGLVCGAIDDVVAWILLAGVLAMASGHTAPLLVAVIGVVVFGVLMATVVRRLLAWTMGSPKLTAEVRLLVTVAVLFAGAAYT